MPMSYQPFSFAFAAVSRLMLGAGTALLATVLAACNTGREDEVTSCPNLPLADLVLGQPGFTSAQSNNGGITAQSMNGALGAATGNAGVFYVADTLNHRVLGFSTPGTNAQAATFALGQPNLGSNQIGGGSTGFANPAKVSISSDGGKLLVADSSNNRVLIWNALPSGNTPPDIVIGQTGFTDAEGRNLGAPNGGASAPTASTLSNPASAVIANGKLFVADKGNNRVLIWNTVPTASGVAANVELGQTATDTTKGSCTSNTGDQAYCFTTTVADIDRSVGTTGGFDLRLNQPSDIATDGQTYLFVSDTSNNRVLYWNNVPTSNNAFPNFELGQAPGTGSGSSGFGQNASGSGNQKMSAPVGIFSTGSSLYVADSGNNRVLVFTGMPILQNAPLASGLFGQADFTHVTYNDPDQNSAPGDQRITEQPSGITKASFYAPTGVFVSADGKLYVSDRNNNRILQFQASAAVNGGKPNTCARP